jgi:hypothetical protein
VEVFATGATGCCAVTGLIRLRKRNKVKSAKIKVPVKMVNSISFTIDLIISSPKSCGDGNKGD